MPKRRAVGAAGALPPPLTRNVKRRLKRRARRQARKEYAPQIAAARGGVKAARRTKRREMRSIRGAAETYENAIDAARAQLKASGLKGQARQQVLQSFAAADLEAARFPAFAGQEARQAFREERATAREEVAGLKADRATDTAQGYESLLSKAFTRAQSTSDARKADKESEEEGGLTQAQKRSRNRARRNAALVLETLLAKAKNPPKTSDDWRAFGLLVAQQADGADQSTAMWAIRQYLKRQRQAEKRNPALTGQAFSGATASGPLGG